MKNKLYTDGYVVLDNFITEENAAYLNDALLETYEKYPMDFCYDAQCNLSPAIYDMWQFLEVLVEKIPEVASAIEEPIFPTYCYARLYKNGDVLEKHVDRGPCEISVTLHLGSDGVEWPIWFEKPSGEQVFLNLKPGQAALYLGCESPHWRDKYEGHDYRQVFLHYVKARGVNKVHYFDKR